MKIKIFNNSDGIYHLEREVNEFLSTGNIEVINQSLSVVKDGYTSRYVLSIMYKTK